MSDDLDWEQLLKIHRAESEERLATMEAALLDLERNPSSPDAIESLRRDAHTLKGNAGMFGFNAISSLAHAFEDGLDSICGSGASRARLEVLLRAVDLLRSALAAAEPEAALTPAEQEMATRLRNLEAVTSEDRMPRGDEPPVEDPPSGRPGEAPEEGRSSRATLRVETSRVEALIELASEISIARSRLENLLASAELEPAARDALDDALPPFGSTHRRCPRDAPRSLRAELRDPPPDRPRRRADLLARGPPGDFRRGCGDRSGPR
jgi:two-component system chemotaxis sensor kinase CheA